MDIAHATILSQRIHKGAGECAIAYMQIKVGPHPDRAELRAPSRMLLEKGVAEGYNSDIL